MTEPNSELLVETLCETLEEAAFVFAEPDPAPLPFTGKILEARIRYEGPQAGELQLLAGRELATTVAANLLGEEEGEAALQRSADALGELLNMMVGSFVVRLFGHEARCRLGLPVVREVAAAALPAAGPCAAQVVDEEGRRIDLRLAREGSAP